MSCLDKKKSIFVYAEAVFATAFSVSKPEVDRNITLGLGRICLKLVKPIDNDCILTEFSSDVIVKI